MEQSLIKTYTQTIHNTLYVIIMWKPIMTLLRSAILKPDPACSGSSIPDTLTLPRSLETGTKQELTDGTISTTDKAQGDH